MFMTAYPRTSVVDKRVYSRERTGGRGGNISWERYLNSVPRTLVRASDGRIITWSCHNWWHVHSASGPGYRIMPAPIVEPIVGVRCFCPRQISNYRERQGGAFSIGENGAAALL